MLARVPDQIALQRVLAEFDTGKSLSDDDLAGSLHSPSLMTGLDHWQLWTLICLCRHLPRQRWVGYMVETRLGGNLSDIGRGGSLGHPENIPQSGEVPGDPEWRYFFHGRGCCLDHQETGTKIDVDFTDEGACDRIDRYFYNRYLQEIKQPAFPEQQLQRKPPFADMWMTSIESLVAAGCINSDKGLWITRLGQSIFESLEPLLDKTLTEFETGTTHAHRQLLRLTLELGDNIASSSLAEGSNLKNELTQQIIQNAEKARIARAHHFVSLLQRETTHAHIDYLVALADLDTDIAKPIVEALAMKSPVDGVANTALEILADWHQPDFQTCLERLLDKRYAEAFGFRSLFKRFYGTMEDRMPREMQTLNTIFEFLQCSPPASLEPLRRSQILTLLKSTSGTNAGEAALMLYLLDKELGLRLLRQALSGKIPANHKDAAAACVLLGDPEALRILLAALENPDELIQHTAASALSHFPSAEAKARAVQWFNRMDGIASPAGEELSIGDRTIRTYSFTDISHTNMDSFVSYSLNRQREKFAMLLPSADK